MNNQNILRKGGTKLDSKIDSSELYDYELVEDILGKVDIILDYSEYYDYDLGENLNDYVYAYTKVFIYRILTEDGEFLITEDGFKLRY
jgi:hypothetical protein